jgi:L-histidine N-alpha-methyltransferase
VSVDKDVRLEIQITPENPAGLLPGIREGLSRSPREISSRFLYDDAGSKLFEQITELPEYYQTRTEEKILREVAGELIQETRAEELIELGSGAATKTRILLDAMKSVGSLGRYIPFDVSEGIVHRVAEEILEEYPEIRVHAVVADFNEHMEIPPGHWQLCIFLGGTIGNFEPDAAVGFIRNLGRQLESGDHFLLGTDLIKDKARLEAAYNDSQGVTAAFNKNSLLVLNNLLDGNFDPEAFEHHAP